ncbi:MAG: bifunctional nuclease family protein [Myxococcales bacterium]|nr:bifunctional nuclease family protein [Myxococcales bacterium]MCB9643641.1 bifunctional nuclease family protein [Myxococcales bacterium]
MSEQEKREEELVPMRIVGLAMDPFNNSPIVLLKDKRPLFEIIAAMRKKRAVHVEGSDDYSFASLEDSDDLEDEIDLDEDGDDFDDESESFATERRSASPEGAGEAAEDTTSSLMNDTRDDLEHFDEEMEIELELEDDDDEFEDDEEFEEEDTPTRRRTHGLRERDVESLLAGMEGKTEVTVTHPSSMSEEEAAEAQEESESAREREDDDDERRALLPIWIGEAEANAIATEMLGIVTPRPMTHDLLKQAIAAMGGAVFRVIVTDIRDNTFYAAIEVKRGQEDVISLDARPSDALAIALRFGADIFVHDRVLEKTQQRDPSSSNSPDELDEIQEDRWKEIVQRRSEDSLDKYKQ